MLMKMDLNQLTQFLILNFLIQSIISRPIDLHRRELTDFLEPSEMLGNIYDSGHITHMTDKTNELQTEHQDFETEREESEREKEELEHRLECLEAREVTEIEGCEKIMIYKLRPIVTQSQLKSR